MNQFSLFGLLLLTAFVSACIAYFLRFPGPAILLLSFVPLVLVFRRAKPGGGTASELKLIAMIAIASIPPYLAAGPVVAAGDMRSNHYRPIRWIARDPMLTYIIDDYYELWRIGFQQATSD